MTNIKVFTYTVGSSINFNLATATGGSTASIAALTSYQTLSTSTNGNAASDNVLVTSNTTIGVTDTVNAVLVRGANVAISGGVLTVGTGMVATSRAGNTISTTGLVFGSEGVLISDTDSSTTQTISGTITGTGGLTFSGLGSQTLSGTNSVTGTRTLNSGTLTFAANNAGTGAFTLTGGTFQATAPLVVSGAVTLNNSAVTIGGSSPIDFTGTISLNGLNDTLNVTNSAQTTVGGVIQDGANAARALTKLGAGTLVLTGNNSYTGQTNILGGVLSIQNSSALGSNNSQLSPTTTANASLLNGTATNPAAVAGTPGAPTMVAATSNGGGTVVGTGATLQMVGGLF